MGKKGSIPWLPKSCLYGIRRRLMLPGFKSYQSGTAVQEWWKGGLVLFQMSNPKQYGSFVRWHYGDPGCSQLVTAERLILMSLLLSYGVCCSDRGPFSRNNTLDGHATDDWRRFICFVWGWSCLNKLSCHVACVQGRRRGWWNSER